MKPGESHCLLRIFLGESDRSAGRPLWEVILEILRKNHFSGATVIRGIAGFGPKSVLHKETFFRFSPDLPVIIESVEREEKIRRLLPSIVDLMQGGLITMERAEVAYYGPGTRDPEE
ncbi:MAG: DUF190 domain-containing protein [Candidatus Hydrogenedentota bacterium]|nr:MAG: DUF190 domain-containing protein [Candidatus Hydrogenedentota bacterium]